MTKFKNDLTVISTCIPIIGIMIVYENVFSKSLLYGMKSILVPPMISCFTNSYTTEFLVQTTLNALNSVIGVLGQQDDKVKPVDKMAFFAATTTFDMANIGIKYLLSDGIQSNQISEEISPENFMLHSNSME